MSRRSTTGLPSADSSQLPAGRSSVIAGSCWTARFRRRERSSQGAHQCGGTRLNGPPARPRNRNRAHQRLRRHVRGLQVVEIKQWNDADRHERNSKSGLKHRDDRHHIMRLEGGVEAEAFGCKGVMRHLPPEQEAPLAIPASKNLHRSGSSFRSRVRRRARSVLSPVRQELGFRTIHCRSRRSQRHKPSGTRIASA